MLRHHINFMLWLLFSRTLLLLQFIRTHPLWSAIVCLNLEPLLLIHCFFPFTFPFTVNISRYFLEGFLQTSFTIEMENLQLTIVNTTLNFNVYINHIIIFSKDAGKHYNKLALLLVNWSSYLYQIH